MRRLTMLLVDSLGIISALFLAASVRFDGDIPRDELQLILYALPGVVVGKLVALHLFNCHRWSFRYAGPTELRWLLSAISLGTLLGWAATYLAGPSGASRGSLLLEPLFTLFILGSYRFGFRVLPDRILFPKTGRRPRSISESGRNIIIIGAGDAGVMTLREIRKHPQSDMNVVGFIDDNASKKGLWIDGVRVIGGREEIPAAVAALKAEELIIAIPSASGETVREMIAACREVKTRFRVVPGLLSIIKGDVDFERIRELKPEDLLGREMIEIDPGQFRKEMSGRKVLVTGAGGSIGSELCRQLLDADARIVLVDLSETAIYMITQELGGREGASGRMRAYIADVRRADRIREIMDREKPEIVFHAAAFKHVPLMEENVSEAVSVNIIGTRNVAEAAAASGVSRFVFISTDKAVRPASVMGATKRAAEKWLFAMARHHGGGMLVSAVRFGNVFGSSGSAPLLFRRQIESGGPVTVTHPHVVRFFMTVQEAVFLVIQASILAKRHELFVLEMGQPIRILDLAKNMITLAGLRPELDIPIHFTGLRPGEKLFEEVLTEGENVAPAGVEKVFRITRDEDVSADFTAELDSLGGKLFDEAGLRTALKKLVPEYAPQ
ncbi:MAG: nucleoside-diphosphate sugar epimerase/dehydratase [Candidatus Hydrogenedentota bacterium]